MVEQHLDAVTVNIMQMCCQTLGTADRPVTAAGTAEVDGEVCETAAQVFFHGGINQSDDTLHILLDFALTVKEPYNFRRSSVKHLVTVIQTGILHASAIEDKTAAVAAAVLRDTLAERKAGNAHCEYIGNNGWHLRIPGQPDKLAEY